MHIASLKHGSLHRVRYVLSASNASGSTTADLTFQAASFSQRLATRTLRNPERCKKCRLSMQRALTRSWQRRSRQGSRQRSLLGSPGHSSTNPFWLQAIEDISDMIEEPAKANAAGVKDTDRIHTYIVAGCVDPCICNTHSTQMGWPCT